MPRMAVADNGLSEVEVARVLQPPAYSLFKVDELGRPDSSGESNRQWVFRSVHPTNLSVGRGSPVRYPDHLVRRSVRS